MVEGHVIKGGGCNFSSDACLKLCLSHLYFIPVLSYTSMVLKFMMCVRLTFGRTIWLRQTYNLTLSVGVDLYPLMFGKNKFLP